VCPANNKRKPCASQEIGNEMKEELQRKVENMVKGDVGLWHLKQLLW
jgi:hypothetical protein